MYFNYLCSHDIKNFTFRNAPDEIWLVQIAKGTVLPLDPL